jgi:hypothetical protein
VADRVVAGLLQHRSQLHVIHGDDTPDIGRWKRDVSREHSVIAWPPRPPSAGTLSDIFEDLS